MFNEHDAGPEQINKTVVTGYVLNRFFETRYGATTNTEDIEEFIPESLLLCLFPFCACPFLRKGDCAMANFIPRQRHGGIITELYHALSLRTMRVCLAVYLLIGVRRIQCQRSREV